MKELMLQVKTTIDQKLHEQMAAAKLFPQSPLIKEAMNHALFAGKNNGGSRRRPALSHIVARMLGNKTEILHPCVGMELLHVYSLVVDDKQDGDAMRYGEQAVHVKFGTDTADMAANCLFGRGMIMLSKTIPDIVERVDFMHAGQDADLRSSEWGDERRTDDWFRFISNGKTGALFALAMRIGATGMGLEEEKLQLLERFGTDLGYLYQIADDYMEVTGESEQTGKPTGKDRGGKLTFMALHSPTEARDIIIDKGRQLEVNASEIASVIDCKPVPLIQLTQHITHSVITG